MNQEAIQQMLNEAGPVVKAVLLKADGTVEEHELDMSPAKNATGKLLGGSATFLGQFPTLKIVIMTRRESDDLPESKHNLPAPFDKAEVRGDMLFVRMNKDAIPESFTEVEYRELLKNPPAPEPEAPEGGKAEASEDVEMEVEDEDEEDEDESEEDEDEEEEGEDDDYWQAVLDKIRAGFVKKFNRDPTEEELKVIVERLNSQGMKGEEEEEGDEESGSDDEESSGGEGSDEEDEETKEGQVFRIDAIKSEVESMLKTGKKPLVFASCEAEKNMLLKAIPNSTTLQGLQAAGEKASAGRLPSSVVILTVQEAKGGAAAPSGEAKSSSFVDGIAQKLLGPLIKAFKEKMGREPTEQEFDALAERIAGDEEMLAAAADAASAQKETDEKDDDFKPEEEEEEEENEEGDEKEEEDEEMKEEEAKEELKELEQEAKEFKTGEVEGDCPAAADSIAQRLLAPLLAAFKEKMKRAPSEDEYHSLLEQIVQDPEMLAAAAEAASTSSESVPVFALETPILEAFFPENDKEDQDFEPEEAAEEEEATREGEVEEVPEPEVPVDAKEELAGLAEEEAEFKEDAKAARIEAIKSEVATMQDQDRKPLVFARNEAEKEALLAAIPGSTTLQGMLAEGTKEDGGSLPSSVVILTLSEAKALKAGEDGPAPMEEEEVEGEEGEDKDGPSSQGLDAIAQKLMAPLIGAFKARTQRDPSEDEFNALIEQIASDPEMLAAAANAASAQKDAEEKDEDFKPEEEGEGEENTEEKAVELTKEEAKEELEGLEAEAAANGIAQKLLAPLLEAFHKRTQKQPTKDEYNALLEEIVQDPEMLAAAAEAASLGSESLPVFALEVPILEAVFPENDKEDRDFDPKEGAEDESVEEEKERLGEAREEVVDVEAELAGLAAEEEEFKRQMSASATGGAADGIAQKLLAPLLETFKKKMQRDPTEEEFNALMEQITQDPDMLAQAAKAAAASEAPAKQGAVTDVAEKENAPKGNRKRKQASASPAKKEMPAAGEARTTRASKRIRTAM